MKNPLSIDIDSNRVFGLDVLRAFAILFVILGHSRTILPPSFHKAYNFLVYDGVSIFFVLSGFLIGGILIKIIEKNKPTPKLLLNFWIRRWFRTLPNYFFILLILTLIFIFSEPDFKVSDISLYFIFSQNLWYSHPPFFPEAWSLSIEEWFYLLIPILIFILVWAGNISPKRSILYVAVLILVSVTLFRYYRYLNIDVNSLKEWDLMFRKQVFTRLDSLMYGVIGSYLKFHSYPLWKRHKNTLLILGLGLFLATKINDSFRILAIGGLYNCVFSFSIISLATLFLLPYLSEWKSGKGFTLKFFTIISLISYSMYLVNLSLVRKQILMKIHWDSIVPNPTLQYLLIYFLFWAITIILSILIYKYFEIPTTKLRDRFS